MKNRILFLISAIFHLITGKGEVLKIQGCLSDSDGLYLRAFRYKQNKHSF